MPSRCGSMLLRRRLLQALLTLTLRATGSSYGENKEVEGDIGNTVDIDQKQETSDSSKEGYEDPALDEDSLEGLDELSERRDNDENDEDDEDLDIVDEFQWLKSINIQMKADDAADSPPVGFCEAKLIDRDYIRDTFHRDMEKISDDTATVGFDVFNRRGCLKSGFLTHPVKKGTGVWGSELNEGRFLLIEPFLVQESYQRKGYGKKLFEQVWAKAQNLAMQEDKDRRAARKERLEKGWEDTSTEGERSTEIDDDFLDRMDNVLRPDEKVSSDCDFAIVWASVLNTHDLEVEAGRLSTTEQEPFYKRKQSALEDFWRAMGFRRIGSSAFFCFARDPDHASNSLLPTNDYIRPPALRFTPRAADKDFPLMDPVSQPNDWETKEYDDGEIKELLEARLRSIPATDPIWVSTDRHNNNILHVLARTAKVESLSWTLRQPFAETLRSARNHEGEKPLEALESQLELDRTWGQHQLAQIVMSDVFHGFTSSQVECNKLLSGLKDPSRSDLSRLTFGCTCGQCLCGFLSPRMAFALECQADIKHEELDDDVEDGNHWSRLWSHMVKYLAPRVKSNLRTNKSMRQGFVNILIYIAKNLQAKWILITHNVLFVQCDENERPPCTRNFLQRGGTVHAVLQACFDNAISQDLYLGDGEHHQTFQEEIDTLPACRNDGEYVFSRRMFQNLEGLPDEV